jgi:hypothetical protein
MMPYYGAHMSPWLVFCFFHLIMAVALWKMAERTKEEPQWFAIVPILNVVLLLKIARKPMWWLILFLLPVVNIIVLIVTTMAICERFGLNKWWGLVSVLSPFNLALYLYMAFGTVKMNSAPPAPPRVMPPVV